MATYISHSPAETAALGEQWGRAAESGLVIGLSGDLGAGKTQLVKGLARGLGIDALVHSPTFALVNIYSGGRLTLFHLDLYRLESPQQIAAAGLDEYLTPAGVTVVEWAERWFGKVWSLESKVQSPKSKVQNPESSTRCDSATARRVTDSASRSTTPPLFCMVQFEVLSETERRIAYGHLEA
jgi:tRNA threonylcarbamoyladenosine biosynthesis protein TsaE